MGPIGDDGVLFKRGTSGVSGEASEELEFSLHLRAGDLKNVSSSLAQNESCLKRLGDLSNPLLTVNFRMNGNATGGTCQ